MPLWIFTLEVQVLVGARASCPQLSGQDARAPNGAGLGLQPSP